MTEVPLKETCEPDVRKVCVFLSDYSAWLLGCGSTCVRLEKNVTRIARAYGKTVDITIMPRHVHISVRDKNGGDFVTSVATIRHTPISFNINTRLSELSWAIAEKRISLREAEERFREIVTNDRQNPGPCFCLCLLPTPLSAGFLVATSLRWGSCLWRLWRDTGLKPNCFQKKSTSAPLWRYALLSRRCSVPPIPFSLWEAPLTSRWERAFYISFRGFHC